MNPSSTGPRIEDGVIVQDTTAPNYAVLRPLNPAAPGIFPVYGNLTDRFRNPANPFDPRTIHPDRTIAHVLATCAGYAYSDANTVSTVMARMGLAENNCRMIAEYVDAMFIMSTSFVVQSSDGTVVILCYRGTQPTSLINWLTDADVDPAKVRFAGSLGASGPYDVHAGFYRNVRATRYKITETLLRAKAGIAVTASSPEEMEARLKPMEVLYITGHSLGAAMAAIETVLARTERNYQASFDETFKATYTFGQPMIGSPELAAACNADQFLGTNVVRFIYQKDPVPHLPPRTTGRSANFGKEYQFDRGVWGMRSGHNAAKQMQVTGEFVVSGLGIIVRALPPLRKLPIEYQLYDHGPQQYIQALTPRGVPSEFGDYNYA
jgi:hypothetical protein